jgi:hypothetical protein
MHRAESFVVPIVGSEYQFPLQAPSRAGCVIMSEFSTAACVPVAASCCVAYRPSTRAPCLPRACCLLCVPGCRYVMNSHLVVNPWAIFEFSTTMDLVRQRCCVFMLLSPAALCR